MRGIDPILQQNVTSCFEALLQKFSGPLRGLQSLETAELLRFEAEANNTIVNLDDNGTRRRIDVPGGARRAHRPAHYPAALLKFRRRSWSNSIFCGVLRTHRSRELAGFVDYRSQL